MARHKLENELIAIEVEEHGAELKSLVRKNTGKEYMWKADPKFWGRTSPVLFPFVGAVKDKQFRTKGQTYTMGQHGFARDMDFTLDSQTEDTLWFVLKSNEETMAKYPLCDMEGNPYLTVTMDAPLFGVWSPAGADVPFICVEPWYGRCDSADFTGDLKDREWGNLIAPGGIWKAHYTVEAV